ncbi:MAG: HK97 family phage prohead protease, partial [Alphaproteobacteria bacterium]|nr:HK97 family phage prohead protease [Alphaproteobacteria bacterium]
MQLERRFASFRADGGVVTGVVVPYGQPSEIGAFRETILAGAFGAIGEIRANVQHDRGRSFAINREGGGLALTDGTEALRARVELPEHGEGPAIRELVERGVLAGFSVEMHVKSDSWEGRNRTVERAVLSGLSLVD